MSNVSKNIRRQPSLKDVGTYRATQMLLTTAKLLVLWTAVALLLIFTSCKKLVEIEPPTNAVSESNVYTNNTTAISSLNGIYASMSSGNSVFTGYTSISVYTGLSADEFGLYGAGINNYYGRYYANALSPTVDPVAGVESWLPIYKLVYSANAGIVGLSSSTANALLPAVRDQLLGEAKFMRAFFYFYLVNLYGDVPLALTTDPQTNTLLTRTPIAQVYEQIIQDLKEAKELLSTTYLNETLLASSAERIRPTKWAAEALLARVYLFTNKYAEAETESSLVISNSSLFTLSALNNAFLKASLGNKEGIWQIQPTGVSFNTREATAFILPASGPGTVNPVYLNNLLLNSFEAGDLRVKPKNWVDTLRVTGTLYTYPFKYKLYLPDNTITTTTGSTNQREFLMMLRLGEQYLIRAEARARLGNLFGAIADLDIIRQRAGLPLIANTNPGISQTALFDKIMHERQVELFSEFGHRWLDIKRTNVDTIMNLLTPQKALGATWQTYQALYPIPLETLNAAPNVRQNPGY